MAQTLKAKDLSESFMSVAGQDLVQKLLGQLAQIKPFTLLFGPYKQTKDGDRATDQQRWADYQRLDWSVRQLPVINVFESQTENQSSTQGYLIGTISIQVYWPPSFRRSDLSRIPQVFKGVLLNFFSSLYCTAMLDEHVSIRRPEKVAGLNEFGKTLTWSPNLEGVIESDAVPVTILDVGYRIDLRAWYRELEHQGRTLGNPFERTLAELEALALGIYGTKGSAPTETDVRVDSTIKVSNPTVGG